MRAWHMVPTLRACHMVPTLRACHMVVVLPTVNYINAALKYFVIISPTLLGKSKNSTDFRGKS